MVGGKWRVIAGLCLEFPCALGFTTLPAMAYLLPNWTHLQLAITLPTLAFIAVAFLIPESPRWLLTKGRMEEAEETLKNAVKSNGLNWPHDASLKPIPVIRTNMFSPGF